jgi:hypothetical protein
MGGATGGTHIDPKKARKQPNEEYSFTGAARSMSRSKSNAAMPHQQKRAESAKKDRKSMERFSSAKRLH